MIALLRRDLMITYGYKWKLPADVLALPRLGASNGYDGLRPRYRGLNATGWPVTRYVLSPGLSATGCDQARGRRHGASNSR